MNNIKIIELTFNRDNFSLNCVLNLWIVLAIVIIFFVGRWLIKNYLHKNKVHKEIVPVKLKYSLGGAEIEYEITRNYQNIEIAHKIYIELITRKAAIEIDKENDVITEIYNSWYTLFQVTRDELKKISGNMLLDNDTSDSLIILLSDILNKGLRPHLTEYQAKFRKWYTSELDKDENKTLSPQEIQCKCGYYNELMSSMVDVNRILIDYSKQLKLIIKGK